MQTKKQSNKRRSNSKKSSTKDTWERFLNKKESINLLKLAWKTPNPQKAYSSKIRSLHRKYSSVKRK